MMHLTQKYLIDALLTLIAFKLYQPAARGPFLYDDLAILEGIKDRTDPLRRLDHPILILFRQARGVLQHLFSGRIVAAYRTVDSRPITTMTYQLDLVGPERTWARRFHRGSNAIHAVNAILVFHILLYWFPLPSAGLGALIFAAHPLSTAAVGYISGRSSALCATFILLSFLLALSGHWFWLPLTFFLAALAKPEAILLPIFLGGLLWLKLV